jgi:DNA polymerase-3 subunit chi
MMTCIHFIETRAEEQRNILCLWTELLYENGKRVQISVDSSMAAQHTDQLLWTFSQASFVPHRVASRDSSSFVEPVVITVGDLYLRGFDILLCEGAKHLDFMKLYRQAVHFVITNDEEKKQESRLLWQKAKDEGFQLRHVPYAMGSKPQTLSILDGFAGR